MKNYLSGFRAAFNREESNDSDDQRQSCLDINLPRLGGKPKNLDLNPGKLHVHLSSYDLEKTQQIQEALKYLNQLNKVELKPHIRNELNSTILACTGKSIAFVYRKYLTRGSSFPENNERKTVLTTTILFLQALILSYKYVVVNDYNLPLRKFNQYHGRVRDTSIRIFELTLWLQRMLAIRFQKLSEQDWHDINSLFTVLANMLDIEEPQQLSDDLALYKSSGVLSEKNYLRSISSMFVSIQIFGLLDISSWPSSSIQIIEKYLAKHENLLAITLDETTDKGSDFVVTYSSQKTPPVFNEKETSFPGCYIDISALKKQAEKDLEEVRRKNFIRESEKKRLQPHGNIENLADNEGLLDLFHKNLLNLQREDERKTLYGGGVVDIYSGIAACYRLIYNLLNKGNSGESEEGESFMDAAARHSSLLVERESDVLECQWRIINESNGGILVRTVETRYMHVMEVGQLVSIKPDSAEENAVPQLGFITRLDRLSTGEVDVAIVKISTTAEAATIMEPGKNISSQEMLPGILIRDLDNHWQLILPRHVKYITGAPVVIKRNNESLPVRLGDIVLSKTGFVLFDVRSPGLST